MSQAWKGGSTRAWRRTRDQVLKDNLASHDGMCRLNIKGKCKGIATAVHHTLGRAVTGDDPRYLMRVCQPCNNHIGDPTRQRATPSHIADLYE